MFYGHNRVVLKWSFVFFMKEKMMIGLEEMEEEGTEIDKTEHEPSVEFANYSDDE